MTLKPPQSMELRERRDGLVKEIAELEQEASIKSKEVYAASRSVEEARRAVTGRRDEVDSQRRLLGDVQQRIKQLREDHRVAQDTIDASAIEIDERTQLVRENLRELRMYARRLMEPLRERRSRSQQSA